MERLLEDAGKLANTKFDISNYGDVIQAIHTIQENLGITGTTAKEAADTIEGSLNSTKAAFENLMVGFARSDADVDKLMKDVEDNIGNLAKNVIPVAERAFISMSKMAISAGAKIARELPALIEKSMGEVHRMIADSFGDSADKIFAVEGALKAAAAAFVTYKAAAYVVDVIDGFKKVNEELNKGVKLAEAMKKANLPSLYAGIAAAVVAVGVALKSWIDTQTDLIQEAVDGYDLLDDKQKQVVDSVHEMSKSISESRKKWEETTDTLETNSALYSSLTEELYRLDEQENLSNDDKKRMKIIVKQLNDEVKGLNIQLDAETGHLKNERAEIENTIDAYKRKIRVQAAEERLLEVSKQQIDLEMKLEQAARERDGAEQKRNQMKLDYASKVIEMQKLQKASAEGLIAVEDQSRVAQRMEELGKELPELKQQIEDQETATHDLQAAHRSLKNQSETLAKTESKLTAEINRGSSAMDDLGDAAEESGEKVTEAFSDDEKVKRALKNIEDTIKGYEKAVEDRESVLSSWLSKSMDVDTSEATKKANEIGENIAKEIEAGIENSSQYVQLGLDRIDDVVKTYNDTLNNRVSTIQSWFEKSTDVSGSDLSEGVTFEALDNALGETQDKLHEWSDGIKELSKRGISEGLLQELEDAGPASLEKIQALLSASDADLERYSKAWEQTYSQIPDVAVTQLEKLRSDCENELAAMVADIQAQSPEFSAAMGAVGFDAANGYILALSDKLPEIESTVKSIFDTAKENIKAQSQTVIDPEITFNDLDKALTSAQAELETWSENIDKLAKRGISEGLLQELENAGPESAAKVKALLNASQPDLERYSKTWESTYKSIPTIAEHQLEKLKTNTESTLKDIIDNIEEETPVFKEAMNAVGVNIADGYLDGLNSKIDEIEAAAKKIFEATQGTVETEAEISSPSKVMRRLGAFVGEGFALGIKDENADVSQAAGTLAQSAITPLNGLEPVEVKAGARSTSQRAGEDESKRYVFNLVTPDGNLIGRWIAPFVDAVQGQMLTFSTEGYAT